jgi:xanthine dehydrogenase accessory factor
MIVKSSNIYEEVLKCQKAGIKSALVTVIDKEGSVPRDIGSKMLVKEDGSIINTIGGGAVEMMVIRDALDVIKKRKPKIVSYSLDEEIEGQKTGMICGGKMDFFIEPIIFNPFIYIFGCGHIGQNLYQLAIMNNFNTIMIDNRKEFADKEKFKDAQDVILCDYKEIEKFVNIKDDSYIVIVTHSHFTDEIALKSILKMNINYKYLGVIGSKKKSEEMKKLLKQEGFSDDVINSIRMPVGIDIKSQTPEEIAISIIAEIIKVKNS